MHVRAQEKTFQFPKHKAFLCIVLTAVYLSVDSAL